jgi:hypothetical protein
LAAKKKYTEAIAQYKAAGAIKPEDTLPKTKVAEMEKLMADEEAARKAAEANKQTAELEARFKEAMKQADDLAAKKKYTEAIAQYKAAGAIKPEDTLPKTKVAEMEKLMADEALAMKNAEIEASYQAALKEGNDLADKKQYQDAIAKFQLAQSIKQNEQLPKDKIAEMQGKLSGAEQERLAAEQQARYKGLMKEASALTTNNELEAAIGKYKEASSVLPNETQPNEEITKLEKRLKDEALARETSGKEAAYQNVMKAGDELAKSKQYQLALEKYTQASFMKPEEKQPKDKMAEMHRLMQEEIANASAAERDAKYLQAMADADAHAAKQSFADAIAVYQLALSIKPEEKLPKERIAQMEKEMASADEAKRMAALRAQFDEAMRAGEAAASANDYAGALTKFQDALATIPSEPSATKRAKDMENLLKAKPEPAPTAPLAADTTGAYLKQLDAEYQMHIQNGDSYFTAKNYAQAKTEYLAALALKRLERYPQSRIKLINELTKPVEEKPEANPVSEAKPDAPKSNDEYERRIAEANSLFTSESWKEAKAAYAYALEANPYSTYAKSRYSQCDFEIRRNEREQKIANAAKATADLKAAREKQRDQHAVAMKEAQAQAEADRAKRLEDLNAMRAAATTKQQQSYQAKDPINRTTLGANAAREAQLEKEWQEKREQEERTKLNKINNQKAKYTGYTKNLERKADARMKENLHHINDRKGGR